MPSAQLKNGQPYLSGVSGGDQAARFIDLKSLFLFRYSLLQDPVEIRGSHRGRFVGVAVSDRDDPLLYLVLADDDHIGHSVDLSRLADLVADLLVAVVKGNADIRIVKFLAVPFIGILPVFVIRDIITYLCFSPNSWYNLSNNKSKRYL